MSADKIILVHNGAVGDFLVAWPAALAVARRFGGDAALLYAGREQYDGWARAAGFQPAPADVRAAVERLYPAQDWNDPALAPLAGALAIWIGLEKPPFAASLLDGQRDSPQLVFLPMVGPDMERESTSGHLARMMRERLCLEWPGDAAAVWQERVARWTGRDNGVLLFPGAGHRAKEWPAARWRELARRILDRGVPCRLALGPAELERGFDAEDIPTIAPESLHVLTERIAAAAAVVCADTGPMHLAGLTGAPAVALFGPTSARQWAPETVDVLRAPVDCRPCSRTTRAIPCETRECMAAIPLDEVERRVLKILEP